MTDLEIYFDNTQKPWGQLFYRILWEQLAFAQHLDILDFGSGFGITANHLAANNRVAAVEPNEKMCEMRMRDNAYVQITGGLEALSAFNGGTFDLIVCHNVLEYVDDKAGYLAALCPLLKSKGKLSLVKHNPLGRVMQKAVFDNDAEQALQLLNGETAYAQNFGPIRYYALAHLHELAASLGMRAVCEWGVRTFFALYPDNAVRFNPEWVQSMFKLEMEAAAVQAFRDIAFYNHIILEKQ